MKKILALSFVAAALIFTGCGENKVEEKKPEPVVEQKVEQPTKSKEDIINEVAADLKKSAEAAIDQAAKTAVEVSKESEKIVAEVAKETKEVSKEMTQVATQAVEEVQSQIDAAADSMMKQKEQEAEANADAKALFVKCAGCHGQKGERAALNKSAVIQGWPVEKTKESLLGYKNGTYGGVMKGVMQSQVANLSEEEIDLLAEYIAAQ